MKVYCAPRDSWDAPKKTDLNVLLFDVPDKKSEGSIGFAARGELPLLVSQVSKGDKTNQTYFARQICGDDHHLQLNHDVNTPESETSQRARSFIFLAYGVVAATALESYKATGKAT